MASGRADALRRTVALSRARTARLSISGLLAALFLLGYLIVTLFPIYWLVTSSLKSPVDNVTLPPVIFFWPTLEAYQRLIFFDQYYRFFLNSAVIAIATTVISVGLGSMAAYWMERHPFRFSGLLSHALLATRMIFPMAYAIPFFLLYHQLGLIGTHIGLVIAYITFGLPFAVWIMAGFYAAIPREVDEAALVDGCSPLGAFFRVVLPMSAPGLAAAGIFIFLLAWNEYLFAVILLGGGDVKTLPVAVASMGRREGLAAISTATILPMLAFFALVHKYLIRGMIAGAVR